MGLPSRRQANVNYSYGAAAEGEFHESLNLAVLWKLPVLFLCENNLYAVETATAKVTATPVASFTRPVSVLDPLCACNAAGASAIAPAMTSSEKKLGRPTS